MSLEVLSHDEYLKGIKDPDALVVCMPTPTPEFPDNIQGECDFCGTDIYYRPYNQNAAKKACINCVLNLMKEGKLGRDASFSDRSIEEIEGVICKQVKK